jgi:hypothetical protein
VTVPGVHRDIRPYEKSAHLLVCSPALIFDKILLSDRRNIGKFRLYVNYFFPQDVVPVSDGG